MTQYNTLNVKLSKIQLSKLKSGTKMGTSVALNLSLTVNSEAFVNSSTANIKSSKTQLSKIVQSGGSPGRLIELLLKLLKLLLMNLFLLNKMIINSFLVYE